jgi:uncharacterized CHY-type Zn-finger protein
MFINDENKGKKYMICAKCNSKISIDRPLPNKCKFCNSDMINGTEKKKRKRRTIEDENRK